MTWFCMLGRCELILTDEPSTGWANECLTLSFIQAMRSISFDEVLIAELRVQLNPLKGEKSRERIVYV